MDIAPIKTQRDYRRALKLIKNLIMAKCGLPEGDHFEILVMPVEAWERRHYPLDLPDPVEAIKYHMDQNGLKPRDLIPFIGSRNRVHEVLNRRRSLTLKMIWRLHEGSISRPNRLSRANANGLPATIFAVSISANITKANQHSAQRNSHHCPTMTRRYIPASILPKS